MKIGFTGTRHGTTVQQREVIMSLLLDHKASEFHHGDCIGADAEAQSIARALRILTVAHPSDSRAMRAMTVNVLERPPCPPLERNRHIVDETQMMLACPQGYQEEQRSGTWATIRYARLLKRPLVIIRPDGTQKFWFMKDPS